MKVEVLDWHTALRRERNNWKDLVVRWGYNPSLHPDWLGFTLEAWGLTDTARVAIFRDDGITRAVIPFIVRSRTILGIPCRTLEPCSNVFSYHAEIVADDVAESLSLLLDARQLPAWDVFRFVNVVAEGASGAAIRELAGKARYPFSSMPGETSPYIEITQDWETFLHSRSKKLRANVTRSERLMRDAGESGMVWYETGSDVSRLLEDMLEIEKGSWKQEQGVAIERGTPQHAYYERLLPWLATNGIMANVLLVRDRPVAYTLCARWNEWVGQLKTSHVMDLGDAGSRVIHSSLQRAFETQCREYDFLGDTAPHKLRWANRTRAHAEYWLFSRRPRGRLLAGAKGLGDRVRQWQRDIQGRSRSVHSETGGS